ncbi:hypothetical protein N9L68_05205, partial [bacterium]|nr:hypothetical protein [bacterium]
STIMTMGSIDYKHMISDNDMIALITNTFSNIDGNRDSNSSNHRNGVALVAEQLFTRKNPGYPRVTSAHVPSEHEHSAQQLPTARS